MQTSAPEQRHSHSPAPWRRSEHYQAIEDAKGGVLFSTLNGTEADERIAAAAPALLTALRHLADAISRDPGAVTARLQEAREAIDLATGSAGA